MSDTPRTDALREVVIGQYKEDELTGNGMGNILSALTDIETLERERECECKCDVDWPEEYYELRQRLERERDEAREEIEIIKKLLLDPNAVRINMLHGKIAKLDWEKLEHVHGNHPAREQLAAERALADRLAEALTPMAWLAGIKTPNSAEEVLSAWKEARGE